MLTMGCHDSDVYLGNRQGTKGLDYFERSQFHHYGGVGQLGDVGGMPFHATFFIGELKLKDSQWSQ